MELNPNFKHDVRLLSIQPALIKKMILVHIKSGTFNLIAYDLTRGYYPLEEEVESFTILTFINQNSKVR